MAKSYKPFISIEVDTKAIGKSLGLKGEKLKEALNLGMKDGMETIAGKMRTNAAKFMWTSYLYNSIQVEPTEDELGYGIKMLNYGMYLNEAPSSAHWTKITPGSKMAFWASAHGKIDKPWMRNPNLRKMYVLTDPKGVYGGWIDKARDGASEVILSSVNARLGDLKNG